MSTTIPPPTPDSQALQQGACLEEFVIEKVLGSGGFGITYLARDTSLGRQVVIKENLPTQFAWRETTTGTVRPRHTTGGDVEDYEWSMKNFLREAETLASLDHPGIVRVLRKFQTNGTAYFVMPFVEGVAFDSLIESRRAKGQVFSEEELHGLTERMLSALGYLHQRGIYHRDIKPANILVTMDGVPVLIDFGSARQRLSERSMTVVESAGYTPFEQLQSRGNVGPWSDLYALGGTLVKALTGEAPPKATDRIRKDPHVPLAQREPLAARFSKGFLASIDTSLAVEETERWQNAGDWLAALRGNVAMAMPPPVFARPTRPKMPETPPVISNIPGSKINRVPWIAAGCAILVLGAWAAILSSGSKNSDAPEVIKATRDQPFVNSLGMKFVPVQITGGAGSDQLVLFSIWETRVQDYRKYAAAKSGVDDEWKSPVFKQGEDHPVVNVNWEDAVAFCEWLTEKDRSEGKILAAAKYRLPTDHEWSCAVGIGDREDAGSTPESKDDKLGDVYPWGTQWPPPAQAGNYSSSLNVDRYENTAPVGSFSANPKGIHDLGGNVWEWCEDWDSSSQSARVRRGGSWSNNERVFLRSACRNRDGPRSRVGNRGFRVVVVGGGG
jgi:serine/threonine protein kinase